MKSDRIDFIARHYSKGCFSATRGWRRLGIAQPARLRRLRVAAAVAAAVVLSASAAIFYLNFHVAKADRPDVEAVTASPLTEVRVIDFENAPLPAVIAGIESAYGVKIGNLPENQTGYTLSLRYEGTPTDLIDVINDILGTQMTVAEK